MPCEQRTDVAEAIEHLRAALRLRPDFPDAYRNLGQALALEGKPNEALEAFQQALKLRPNSAGAHLQSGILLAEMHRQAEAIPCFREAARLTPHEDEAYFRLGNALRACGQAEEAAISFRTVLRLRPDYVAASNNLGVTLVELERYEEAEAVYRTALQHEPEHPGTLNNLGVLLKNTRRLEEAQVSFAHAIRVAPTHIQAHLNRAMAWLLAGDFAHGLPEYEWRLRQPGRAGPPFPQPRWDGSPLAGRTILLTCEQGLGDTLQFVRYVSLLKEQGARVILLAPVALGPILRSFSAIDRIVKSAEEASSFDVHASLLSLPWLLRTTLDTIPRQVPYLAAEEALVERWARVFRPLQAFKVGIAWQGSPHYVGDRSRSISLAHFQPLAEVAGVQLVGLQHGLGVEQIAQVDFPMLTFESQMDKRSGAFMDTAAIMKSLDLVITADTAVGHLAGALGVPTWLVLGFTPDWRWLLDREESPWYPSMRLFRQTAVGDWRPVFARLAEQLKQLVADRAKGPLV